MQTNDFFDEIGDCRGVVEIEDRKIGIGNRMVGGNCADVRIGGGQRLAICRFQPAGLDLRDRFALVALDEHQIARGEPRKDVLAAIRRSMPSFTYDALKEKQAYDKHAEILRALSGISLAAMIQGRAVF